MVLNFKHHFDWFFSLVCLFRNYPPLKMWPHCITGVNGTWVIAPKSNMVKNYTFIGAYCGLKCLGRIYREEIWVGYQNIKAAFWQTKEYFYKLRVIRVVNTWQLHLTGLEISVEKFGQGWIWNDWRPNQR